jgi:hypothetical protein
MDWGGKWTNFPPQSLSISMDWRGLLCFQTKTGLGVFITDSQVHHPTQFISLPEWKSAQSLRPKLEPSPAAKLAHTPHTTTIREQFSLRQPDDGFPPSLDVEPDSTSLEALTIYWWIQSSNTGPVQQALSCVSWVPLYLIHVTCSK